MSDPLGIRLQPETQASIIVGSICVAAGAAVAILALYFPPLWEMIR